MTDRELLELAAKGAGIDLWVDSVAGYRNGPDGDVWNPLTDDGDALRLAAKLQMDVDHFNGVVICATFDIEIEGGDYRRAIVRAAAEIGRK